MAVPDPTLELAVVFESADPVAFSIAKAALEEAGIEYASTEDAYSGYGFRTMMNPVCGILVAQECKDQALELMQGFFDATDPESDAPHPED